jgi:hypothetical protein
MDFRESSFFLIKRSTKVQKLHTVAGMHHDHKLELSKSTSSLLERSLRSLLLSTFLGVFFLCRKHSQPSGRDCYFGRQSEDQRNMPWLTSVVAIVHMIVFIMTMWHNNCPANIVVILVAADY